MSTTFHNFVNGKQSDAADGRTLDLVNPATGAVYATSPLSGGSDVDEAVTAAAAAFETWRDTTPAERQLALLKIADAFERRADEFVKAEGENTGKINALTATEETAGRGRPHCGSSRAPRGCWKARPRAST